VGGTRGTFDVKAGQRCELTFEAAKSADWVQTRCEALP
jgi:hypothetical protein